MAVTFPCVIDGTLKTVFVRDYCINPDSGEAVAALEWEDEYGKKVRHSVPISADDVTTYFPIAAVQANIAAAADAGMTDRFRVTSERIVFDLLSSGVVTDMLNPALYTLTFTRASLAIDVFTGNVINVNVPMISQRVLGGTGLKIYQYAAFMSVTRINDADIRNWNLTGTAVVNLGVIGNNDYRLSMGAGDTVYEDRAVTSAKQHYFGFRARKVSGDMAGATAKLVDASAGTTWVTINLAGLTDEWAWIGAKGTPNDTDGRFIFSAPNACEFDVQFVQSTVAGTGGVHRMPFILGAGAGVTGGQDSMVTTAGPMDNNSLIVYLASMWASGEAYASFYSNRVIRTNDGAVPVIQMYASATGSKYTVNFPSPADATFSIGTVNVPKMYSVDMEHAVVGKYRLYADGLLIKEVASTAAMTAKNTCLCMGNGASPNNQLNGAASFLKSNARVLTTREHLAFNDCLDKTPVVWKS